MNPTKKLIFQGCGLFLAYILACTAISAIMIHMSIYETLFGHLGTLAEFNSFVAVVAAIATVSSMILGLRWDSELKRRMSAAASEHPGLSFAAGVLICYTANWSAAFLLVRDFPEDLDDVLELLGYFKAWWLSVHGIGEGPVFMQWAAVTATLTSVIVGVAFLSIRKFINRGSTPSVMTTDQ